MFVYGDVVMLTIGRYWPWKTVIVSSHLHMPVQSMLLHRIALVSFLLFRKNVGNLREFFWANGLPPPRQEIACTPLHLFPSPSPFIPFFALVPVFSTNSRRTACYAGYKNYHTLPYPNMIWTTTHILATFPAIETVFQLPFPQPNILASIRKRVQLEEEKFLKRRTANHVCDKRDRVIASVFCHSSAKLYFKQNSCYSCHTRFAVVL